MLAQAVCLFHMQPSEFWRLTLKEYHEIQRYYVMMNGKGDIDEPDAQTELANYIAVNGAYR
jgi:hypothetical protein